MTTENGWVLLPKNESIDKACETVNGQGWEVVQIDRLPNGGVALLLRKVTE